MGGILIASPSSIEVLKSLTANKTASKGRIRLTRQSGIIEDIHLDLLAKDFLYIRKLFSTSMAYIHMDM